MKAGLQVGATGDLEITVTPEMRAAFEGITVHNLYSTSSVVHHMELACRKIIVPFLESHEEGMGYHVELSHLAVTLIGMKVRYKARVSEIRGNKVVCEIEGFNPRGMMARGTFTQVVV